MFASETNERRQPRHIICHTYIDLIICWHDDCVRGRGRAGPAPDPRPAHPRAARGMSQPNTSRHLRVLREAGLVESQAAGRRRLYALRGAGFAELARWLTPYVLLWQGGLDALERHLERSPEA